MFCAVSCLFPFCPVSSPLLNHLIILMNLRAWELLHVAPQYNCQAVQRSFLSQNCDVTRSICEIVYLCISRWERLIMRPSVLEPRKMKIPATDQRKQCFNIAAVHVWGLLQTVIKLYVVSESHILTTHKGSPTYLNQYWSFTRFNISTWQIA